MRGVTADVDQAEPEFDQVEADEPFISSLVVVRELSIALGTDVL